MQNKYKDLLFLLDKLPEAVIVISSNKVNYINNKARELLDYYLPLNKPLQYLLNCFQEVDIINFINNYLKNPLNLVVKEVKIFNPKELYLKAVFSPFRSSSFKKGSIIILHDITEEKRLQKLKDDFIANVSHEFKTPLAIIKESISLLLDKVIGKLNNEQEKCLSITYSNIERLTRLIHNILDFSKIEEGHIVLHRELTDINKLAINIFNFFKHNAENRNIKFNLIINHNFPLIYLDSDKITQVITNLISNALQFTNPGGKITLAVKMFKSNICISVQDTGIGIKKEDKEKIFHKFHQINKEDSYGKKGTGLVLTISKSIIRLHGGDLNVKSKHGKGSEFYFNIPLTTEYLSIVNSLFEADNSKDKLKSLNYLKSEGA